jgi:hypothetical protein
LIQVGGFTLAVTLLILNLLGYSAGMKNGRFEIVREHTVRENANPR